MFLQSFRIDKFGGRYNWQFDDLHDTVQVFHGPDGSGKRTLQQFLRSILFGFDDSSQRYLATDDAGHCGGAVTFRTNLGSQTVRRHDDGSVDGHLTVEDDRGRVAGQHHLDRLLSGITADRFDHLFSVDFAARPEVDRLVSHARAAGVVLGHPIGVSKVTELQDRVDRLQREFNSLPHSPESLEELNRRHREISSRLAAGERQSIPVNGENGRARFVETRGRLESQLAESRVRLTQLEKDREELLNRRRQFPQLHPRHELENGSLALELDGRIEQWRQLLTDIAANKRSVQDDLARHDGASARAANPRQPLKDLEQRVGKFESRLADLDHGECVCRPLQTELRHALTEIKQELHSLCTELGRWESAREYRSYAHQMQHLNRCESELQVMVQSLLDSRAAMADQRNERWCQCDSHPVVVGLDRDHARQQMLSELDAELVGVEQLCEEARVRIAGFEAELADLLRRSSQAFVAEGRTFDHRWHLLPAELDSIQQSIEIAEKRRAIAEEIAELKLEIKHHTRWDSDATVLTSASRLLRIFSGDALGEMELDAHHQVWVVDRSSRKLAWHELSAGGRDQVYLSLLLAVQSQLATAGVKLPLVLKDAFSHFEAENVAAAADVICGITGQQVLVLTRYQHVADVFRQLRVAVQSLDSHRDLPRESTPQPASELFHASEDHWNRDSSERLTEASLLEDAPSISPTLAEQFANIGVATVGQLLDLDPLEASRRLMHCGVTEEQMRTWQAQALLMCRVPHLRAYDARILVACDVTDPNELRAISPRRLREIVQRFAGSGHGRSLLMSGTEYELSRVTDWMTTSSNGDDDDSLGRRLERNAERKSRQSRSRSDHQGSRATRASQSRRSGSGNGHRRRRDNGGEGDDRQIRGQDREQRRSDRFLKLQQESGWKFYLNNDDAIVDAPSIGPRTAQRLEEIGIHTVRDFLAADADEVAERLGLKRITGELVLQWQQQTTLATRIPQLRGHDAQILVALGIVDPSELAESDPEELWNQVKPFVATNQGKRIIRNGKQPDFEEVTNWIQFAAAARPLKVA